MATNPLSRELKKLFREHDKAAYALAKKRDELFPPGTHVRSKQSPSYMTTKVSSGSLYPDQVNTTFGHMSWRYLEKIETDSQATEKGHRP